MANSEDPDQTAPWGAVWSGSALFAYGTLSETLVFEILGHLPYDISCGHWWNSKEYPQGAGMFWRKKKKIFEIILNYHPKLTLSWARLFPKINSGSYLKMS